MAVLRGGEGGQDEGKVGHGGIGSLVARNSGFCRRDVLGL
jgi:hypothetical protein